MLFLRLPFRTTSGRLAIKQVCAGVIVNPVLQELLSQLQQKQISFDQFKLDLLGLCKMSPGMVSGARLMIEGAIAQNLIPANAGYQLIGALSPESQPVAKTLLRRDVPGGAVTSANDKTVLMDSVPDRTLAMEKTIA